ncbi:MAG: DUF3379 family protein [Xanthomonadales bacterium]|nr:DUF3379 family protein [Xanthomonadales bacterium]
MDFSEFKRRLGAEPLSEDPELRRACDASPECAALAEEARQMEQKLSQALNIPAPADLVDRLGAITASEHASPDPRPRAAWWRMALAASVLIAVGATGLIWQFKPGWDSVEDYLVDHYRHDGARLVAQAGTSSVEDVQAFLADFDVRASQELAGIVSVVKYCPTPDGKGVHMVLDTTQGLVTVIYMPDTAVRDRSELAFDDVEALLVDLPRGSAAIIGAPEQSVSALYATVRRSILPAG